MWDSHEDSQSIIKGSKMRAMLRPMYVTQSQAWPAEGSPGTFRVRLLQSLIVGVSSWTSPPPKLRAGFPTSPCLLTA